MKPIRSMRELVERAVASGRRRVAVPGAESQSALDAVLEGRARGLAQPILLGDREALVAELTARGEDPSTFAIEHEPETGKAARRAVELVRSGAAEILLKGRLSTSELMRAVLDREAGLRGSGLISDVMVTDSPGVGPPRLIGVTDGGVNVSPSLADKRAILANAVRVFHRLGIERPRVAVLCAIETVSPAMPHTAEAAELALAASRGEFGECEVFGPVALDGALSVEAARAKGIAHPAAGRADVLLVPAIEVGNALGKAFTWLAGKPVGHVLEGAKAPVLIPSRAEGAMDKLCSVALGVLASVASS
jgi:phosphate butyryltransferase